MLHGHSTQSTVFGVSAALVWESTGRVSVLLVPLTGLGRQLGHTLRSVGIYAIFLSEASSEGNLWPGRSPFLTHACAPSSCLLRCWFLNRALLSLPSNIGVGLLSCDEAHVWFDWQSWRPTLRLAAAALRCEPRLGLTDTLRHWQEAALARNMGMAQMHLMRWPVDRHNLFLRLELMPSAGIQEAYSADASLKARLEHDRGLRECLRRCQWSFPKGGNIIMYEQPRKEVDDVICAKLRSMGQVSAVRSSAPLVFLSYHGSCDDRDTVEARFATGKGVVVVATIALALGIDCPNVRLVIHFVRHPYRMPWVSRRLL